MSKQFTYEAVMEILDNAEEIDYYEGTTYISKSYAADKLVELHEQSED
jgi:hypothetical protein